MIDDPYRVLGLSPSATDDEVKKAYRELAKKYHPDANPGDKAAENKMKEINAAYDQIINKDKYASSRRASSYAGSTRNSSYGGAGSGSYGGYGSGGYGAGGYGGYGSGSSGNGTYGRGSTSGSGTGRGNTYQEPGGGWTVWGFPFPFGFGFGGEGGFGGFQVKSDPSDTAYMSAARNYINNGNFSEAVNVLNGINDRNARWYYYNAVANLGLGNKIHALQYAQKAYSMEPSNTEYRNLLQRLQQTSQTYQTVGKDYKSPEFSSYARLMLAFCIILGLTSLPASLCGRGGYICCI